MKTKISNKQDLNNTINNLKLIKLFRTLHSALENSQFFKAYTPIQET